MLMPSLTYYPGATSLMIGVIRHPAYSEQVSQRTLSAAIYTLAVISNIGAVGFTLSASLAGLLWANILRSKGVIIRQRDFAAWNVVPLVCMTMAACAIVASEVEWLE